MSCYVCLEPTRRVSPCRCGAPLCGSCLFTLHCRGFHDCTLCGEVLSTRDWLLFVFLLVVRVCFGSYLGSVDM